MKLWLFHYYSLQCNLCWPLELNWPRGHHSSIGHQLPDPATRGPEAENQPSTRHTKQQHRQLLPRKERKNLARNLPAPRQRYIFLNPWMLKQSFRNRCLDPILLTIFLELRMISQNSWRRVVWKVPNEHFFIKTFFLLGFCTLELLKEQTFPHISYLKE